MLLWTNATYIPKYVVSRYPREQLLLQNHWLTFVICSLWKEYEIHDVYLTEYRPSGWRVALVEASPARPIVPDILYLLYYLRFLNIYFEINSLNFNCRIQTPVNTLTHIICISIPQRYLIFKGLLFLNYSWMQSLISLRTHSQIHNKFSLLPLYLSLISLARHKKRVIVVHSG